MKSLLGWNNWANWWGFKMPSNQPAPPVVSNIKYGRLYNWYVFTDPDIAPDGWRIPISTDIATLRTTLGGQNVAGGKMKETGLTYWITPNEGGSNESGFNGRGSGWRNFGFFSDLNAVCNFFCLDQYDVSRYVAFMKYDDSILWLDGAGPRQTGASIRFIKKDSNWVEGDMLTDLDGNLYRTIKIGNQVWLADNWACTKLKTGTPIVEVTSSSAWNAATGPMYCNYNNNILNVFL
jgi:uncharacterized protein (TIGR02145 family)